ncbi:MAG: MBL fold metallo-hydrolase [Oscillospiraceae bacterium]|nr:MBL fold metallo-hydrolase [Oscillospiraceae bacterium]
MQIHTLASGSSGNSTLISGNGSHVLLDAGISCRKITTRLAQAGLSALDLSGLLITHTHSDHICGVTVLAKRCQLPIYLSSAAADDLIQRIPGLDEKLIHVVSPGQTFQVGGMHVRAFSTPHDAPGSMGYRFEADDKRAAVVTDLGYLSDSVIEALTDIDLALVEANHDVDWLRTGPYPYYLQQRVLGKYGHLSNELCGQLAVHLARTGASKLILAHLSAENNSPQRAWETVSSMLWEAECRDTKLFVAPRDELSGPYAV